MCFGIFPVPHALADLLTNFQIMECLSIWPLLSRNKVEDSKIEEPVKILLKSQVECLKQLAEKVTLVYQLFSHCLLM